MADLRFATFLAPNMHTVHAAIAAGIGAALGCTAELTVADDYEQFRRDAYDVSFLCGLPYVMCARQGVVPAVPVAAPVLRGARYGGRPIYFSDVIVRRDDPADGFLDLRGRTWSYNEPYSQSGYGVTRHHLLSLGETGGFFSRVVRAGSHEESIRMVTEGRVDASAIDSQVLAIEMRDRPDLAGRLKVIDALGPSTIQPVVVSKRTDVDLRAAIRDILIGFGDTERGSEVLAAGNVERFVAIGPSDYDDIRRMVDACAAAGFMEIR